MSIHKLMRVVVATCMACALFAGLGLTQNAEAVGYPSMTYVRFNQYGNVIDATYCIAADNHQYFWGENYPADWDLRSGPQGAINGCRTKRLFYNVDNNESLYVAFNATANNGSANNYEFILEPRPGNLRCLKSYSTSTMNYYWGNSSACAYWDK